MGPEMSRLVVTRPGRHYRDGLRSYVIEVDGETRGAVRAGQSLVLEVPAGPRSIRATIDWTGSPAVTVDARPGGEVRLVVEPAGSVFSGLFQMLSPTAYLTLAVAEQPAPAPPAPPPAVADGDDGWEGPFRSSVGRPG